MNQEGAPLRRRNVPAVVERDLRHAVERALRSRLDEIVADSSAGAPDGRIHDERRQVAALVVHLLSRTVRDGSVEAARDGIGELQQLAAARGIEASTLFAFVYLVERAALDGLAVDPALGATTDSWPAAVSLLRRGSFDVLAAYAERLRSIPDAAAISDPHTGLHVRPVFEAIFAREVIRASRRGDAVALLLFDVDHLASINASHGRSVGDRVLERVSVLIRGFFRQADWVGKSGDDDVAVLLTGKDVDRAGQLAEEVREMVETRMQAGGFDGADTPVTVSGAVAVWPFAEGATPDADRLRTQAESALARAKRLGRNRVERAGPYSVPISS
jgi:diguanylate cyclase (GGDEF)-like protein